MYNKLWTQFETQSLAFAILRKSLYPEYLVRGEQGYITIYKPTADTRNPIQKVVLHVEASSDPKHSSFESIGVRENIPHFKLIGGDTCYKATELITPYL